MSLSIAGTAAVGISKGSAKTANGMNGMSAMSSGSPNTPNNVFVDFFSGIWGEVILLTSFGLMIAGIWFTGRRKLVPAAITGATILFVSMYAYYSVTLEIIGIVLLVFVYASTFSYSVAKATRLA
jgi:hypothetical protein